jgi:hypothetical protein
VGTHRTAVLHSTFIRGWESIAGPRNPTSAALKITHGSGVRPLNAKTLPARSAGWEAYWVPAQKLLTLGFHIAIISC